MTATGLLAIGQVSPSVEYPSGTRSCGRWPAWHIPTFQPKTARTKREPTGHLLPSRNAHNADYARFVTRCRVDAAARVKARSERRAGMGPAVIGAAEKRDRQ